MKKIFPVTCAAVAALLAGTALASHASAGELPASAAKTYSNYNTVRSTGTELFLEPTLVYEPASFAEIGGAKSAEKKPASVIVTPDKEMNVTLGGTVNSLASVFDTYLKGSFIPVVRLDATTVDPFITWLKTTYTISDIMAVSSEISVISKLYADSTAYLVNTVYDLTDATIGEDRYGEWDHIAEANKAGCNILMYDGSEQNLPVAAEYVEAMAKVCWAVTENKEEAVSALAAGCYGIVSDSYTEMGEALDVFSKPGFARAQFVAAHRGITGYCNEQSPTAIAASANEGATHIELDIQITKDGQIFICHNSETNYTSTGTARFAVSPAAAIKRFTLSDYSRKYQETFPTLEEAIELLADSDVIFIIELKLDAASALAVDELQAIETLKEVMDSHPEMKGRWIAITFYGPYAEKMKEVCPEIPVGCLGGGLSEKEKAEGKPAWGGASTTRSNVSRCMQMVCRKYNVSIDEMDYDNVSHTNTGVNNKMWTDWIARGYALNTWTFENLVHFSTKCNIATSNAAEDCAMLVKEIGAPDSLTEADLAAGKVTVPCTTYNGWKLENECDVIVVSRDGNKAKVLFYLTQNTRDDAKVKFGLYSNLTEITIG